jgi:hypothetical protein
MYTMILCLLLLTYLLLCLCVVHIPIVVSHGRLPLLPAKHSTRIRILEVAEENWLFNTGSSDHHQYNYTFLHYLRLSYTTDVHRFPQVSFIARSDTPHLVKH